LRLSRSASSAAGGETRTRTPGASTASRARRGLRKTIVFFQSSVPGGHENYFGELMAIMEASQGRPDANVVADLRARYDIEQITAIH
jgi:hypothetical protein